MVGKDSANEKRYARRGREGQGGGGSLRLYARLTAGTVGRDRGSCRPAPRKREQLRVTKQRPTVCRRDIARVSRRSDRRGGEAGSRFRSC